MFELENNNTKLKHNFNYTMYFIKKIIKLSIIISFFCFGILQAQEFFTPLILSKNNTIANRKHEFYAKTQNSLQLYSISDNNEYDLIWEYKLINSKINSIKSLIMGDITGDGSNELVALVWNKNNTTSLYIFKTEKNLPSQAPEIFEIKTGLLNSQPIEAKLAGLDLDKDEEIIISFGSPERKIILIDYIIDDIKIIKSLEKEFLLNTYGPIDFKVFDKNNDRIDDIFIYSNSANLEQKTVLSNEENIYASYNISLKQIEDFFIYKQDKIVNELGKINSTEIYSFTNKEITTLSQPYEKIHYLSKNQFLLIDKSSPMKIIKLDGNKIVKVHEFEKDQLYSSNSMFQISLNKESALFVNSDNNTMKIVSLKPPYNSNKIDVKNQKISNIAEKEPVATEKEVVSLESIPADTLIAEIGKETTIPLPKIKDYFFKDLETLSKPEGITLALDELAFIWSPTKQEAGYHDLKYKATYNSKPQLTEKNINNQLVVNTTIDEKKITENKIIYANDIPSLVFKNSLDTIPVYSDFETTFEIKDINQKDKHTISILNQKSKNPMLIEKEKITWSPTKADAGNNTFEINISDGFSESLTEISVFIDTSKKENIYNERLIATTDKEFIYQLPYEIGNKYTAKKKPENLRITKKGKIYWIPLPTQIENNIIEVEISNNLLLDKYLLDVYVNSPPIIAYRPALEEFIDYGEEFNFTCQSFDLNEKAELNWIIEDNNMGAFNISELGEISFADTSILDNILYTIELNDGIDRDVFNGVLYVNATPEFEEMPDEYIELGDTLSYLLSARDINKEKAFFPGQENLLYYNLLNAPTEAFIDQSNHLVWVPEIENLGENNFIIEVTDSLASSQQKFTIFVNDKPSIVSEDSLSIELGDTLKHLFYIKDLNNDSEFSFNIKTTLDEILFSRKTGTLTWIPDSTDLGLHNLEISVSDGISQSGDTQKLKIYVYKNPELTKTPPNQAFVNVEYLYQPTAIDLYNQSIYKKDVFFEFENPDTNLNISYNQNSNLLKWVPSMSEIGTHDFVLNIKDSHNHNVAYPFDIQVILSPCENPDTLKINSIDTLYQTIIDSVFIKQIDTLMINQIDTIAQIKIDSIFVEKIDTVKVLIDSMGKIIEDKPSSFNIPFKQSAFERNNKKKK